MGATVESLWRSPVKGLSMERLQSARLEAGAYFPGDRRYAVEVGPSGFDPAARNHVSKMRFTVLARFPDLARLHTRYIDEHDMFHVGDRHGFGVEARLGTEDGRAALARFLQAYLGEAASAPLHVLPAPQGHAFMDHPRGHVSVMNLASVRAVAQAIGAPVDALRFRANVLVEGWPAWIEDEWIAGSRIRLGGAEAEVFKPIERCIATHVNTETGERDIDMVGELRRLFDRVTLGVYVNVTEGGELHVGDAVEA